jgi:uncharacterized protein (TIGR04255 family)
MTENASPLPGILERRYNRPPVVEALCEVYFSGSHWGPSVDDRFHERVRGEFPQKSQMEQIGFEVQLGPGQAGTRALPVEPRWRLAKEDQSRFLQLSRDLLVVNQLRPYPHYEEWSELAHRSIEAYRQVASPAGVTRLGLRYINRLDIPLTAPIVRMEDYFHIYPHIPSSLGDTHGPFMLQLVMIPLRSGHNLTLTLATGPPQRQGFLSFLLDLYEVVELGGREVFGDLRRWLDDAHENIVNTFENTITAASRELFRGTTGD